METSLEMPQLKLHSKSEFNGHDTLLFRVSDGSLESEIATVTIQ